MDATARFPLFALVPSVEPHLGDDILESSEKVAIRQTQPHWWRTCRRAKVAVSLAGRHGIRAACSAMDGRTRSGYCLRSACRRPDASHGGLGAAEAIAVGSGCGRVQAGLQSEALALDDDVG